MKHLICSILTLFLLAWTNIHSSGIISPFKPRNGHIPETFQKNDSTAVDSLVYEIGNLKIRYQPAQGFVAFRKNGERLFIVHQIDNGPDYPSEGLFRITDKNQIGFADTTGNIIVKPKYSAAYPFSGGMAAFCRACKVVQEGEYKSWSSGKWGFINHEGKEVIPPAYDTIIGHFSNDTARVMKGDNILLINKSGKIIHIDTMKVKSWIQNPNRKR